MDIRIEKGVREAGVSLNISFAADGEVSDADFKTIKDAINTLEKIALKYKTPEKNDQE
jgi:hypothetical protein